MTPITNIDEIVRKENAKEPTDRTYQLSADEINIIIATIKVLRDGKYQLPTGGIPSTDLSSAVRESLTKANNAASQSTTYTKAEVDGKILPVDAVPTSGSNNLVKSGGVRSYFDNLRAQLRGYGVSAQGGVVYNRGIDPVFYCGSFNSTYHGADAEILMNEELNKLHSPNGLSNKTYECNAADAELRGTRPIPGGICHINLHGSQIWFINNVESYSEDRWTQVFFNAAAGYNESRVRPGKNIVIRFRIKTDPTLERYDAWSEFYEIPYNIMERFFPSDPQNYDNANRITETGFRGYVNGGIPVESGMTWGSLAVRRASTADANGFIAVEQTFYARDGNHIGKSWRRLGLINTREDRATFFDWYD